MLVDLSHYEFVRVSGPDRHKFLQGQVSCDITQLTPELSLRGALCNLKGRVIADFRAVEYGEHIILQTQQGMASVIEAVLRKYAVFSKVELQVLKGEAVCTGILADDNETRLQALFSSLPQAPHQVVAEAGLILIKPSGDANCFELWSLSGANSAMASLNATDKSGLAKWHALEMRAGEAHVTPELSEEYTPQLLNYDVSGVINFRKGCYTGQEVVARMFYRVEAKKRLYLYSSDSPIDPALAFVTAGERQYPVLQIANADDGVRQAYLLFAVVDVEVAESGEEMKAGTGTILSLVPLHYSTGATD